MPHTGHGNFSFTGLFFFAFGILSNFIKVSLVIVDLCIFYEAECSGDFTEKKSSKTLNIFTTSKVYFRGLKFV